MRIKKLFDKHIVSTLALICCISFCFVIASIYVNRIAKKSCFDTLDDAASQVAGDIYEKVRADGEQLDVVADLLSQHEKLDSDTVKKHISSFRQRGSLSAVGILLPDNQLILGTGSENERNHAFDYEKELDKIPYVSGVTMMPGNSKEKVIYQAVPVEKDGRIIGILYGFVDLEQFSLSIDVTAFDGNAKLFVADGETGDFLVDTLHDRLGNVFDEDIADREVKSGYDYHQMKVDFTEGKEGHIAFWSNSAGEYLYSYYRPVGVNRWMVQLTVPESIAFSNEIQIRKVLYCLVAVEIVLFILYFLWVLLKTHQEAEEKERQLAQSRYMYDVQQILFDAHKDSSKITIALQKVAEMLTAKTTFLMAVNGTEISESFSSALQEKDWRKHLNENKLDQLFPRLFQRLSLGQNLLFYEDDIKLLQSEQDLDTLMKGRISGLMMVPVLDSSEDLIGILGGVNMKKHWRDTSLLECVSRNFMMALNNMDSYRQIERMGIIDALTGLRNRNCYEHSLGNYEEKKDELLCCLYIDANGLHELNNTLGHTAGDEMLIFIGSTLKSLFGPQDTYRIGGDEFTAFCVECDKGELQARIDSLNEQVNSHGYHISIGEAWLDDCADVKEMVSVAESRMYEEKRLYYQNNGNVSKARIMNQKLEQILLEKKDADAFLDIISIRFMGVYVVDLKTDIARVIFRPSYFSEILEKNEYHFIPSMQEYIREYVETEGQEEFRNFLNYDHIHEALTPDQAVKYRYQKKDGTRMSLRIYLAKDQYYGPDNSYTIWLFEKKYA